MQPSQRPSDPLVDDLDCLSAEYVEGLLGDYLKDPSSAPPAWRDYFQNSLADSDLAHAEAGTAGADGNGQGRQPTAIGPSFQPRSLFHVIGPVASQGAASGKENGELAAPASAPRRARLPSPEGDRAGEPAAVPIRRADPAEADGTPVRRYLKIAQLQDRVDQLIRGYRVRGHLAAQIDPLGLPRPVPPEMTLAHHGLSEDLLDRPFSTTSIGGPQAQTLRDIVERLRNTYCRTIGVQFMHIDDLSVREWLQSRMEDAENRLTLHKDEQFRILTRLTDAEIFEQFVRKKYLGAKTFSLEGAETLIPLLHLAIEKASRQGVDEIVLGMAHRGRLNVLVNILGKSPLKMFWEFEDNQPELHRGGGDVKYHLGYSSDWTTSTGREVHLSLCFNPSHLEFVNPVALGRMRAKQDRFGDSARRRGMVLLIHGDAAFAGEGVVQETLNLSELPGYHVGGALHVIVNNQIGFTTTAEEGRSSTYATDVAKMLQIPIFHVNGEDPEAVAQVVNLALDFRQQFQRDVVIDMYCFRRLGHNESDEPSFTQPVMYHEIERRKSVRESYLDRLLAMGDVTREKADRIAERRREHLEEGLSLARQSTSELTVDMLSGHWRGYQGGKLPVDEPETGVASETLTRLMLKLCEPPEGMKLHKRLPRLLEQRRAMGRGEERFDWASAELLAFATLAAQGMRVRLTGQDCIRGTFSQRHAGFYDAENGRAFMPLQHLDPAQGPVEIVNSPLSETGVLGFEYGYSLDWPDGLIAWEAQFGDFCNAAQVIIDQFIASAEEKWRRLSGLVLLLPHGFEGQGPEHSSARMERFLALAAEDNMQIAYPSTPAQYFHLLRRQAIRKWKKPLVVFTPKSLLRRPQAVSPLADLTAGVFQRAIAEHRETGFETVRRLLLCSGKVYYDLLEEREKRGIRDIDLIRLEELYPFPERQLRPLLAKYPAGTPAVWVQEEPDNMGAWRYLRVLCGDRLFDAYPLSLISRPESASPATGSKSSHELEQRDLLDRALSP